MSKKLGLTIEGKLSQIDAIISGAEALDRDLTADEAKTIEKIEGEIRVLEEVTGVGAKLLAEHQQSQGSQRSRPNELRNSRGERVTSFSKDDRPENKNIPPDSFGQYLVAKVCGVSKWTPDIVRNAMTSTSDLTPDELATWFIDKARSRMVLADAGCRLFTMQSGTMTIPRITADPSHVAKSENSSFNESSITVGHISAAARVVGCYVAASRELIEDSPQAATIIQEVLIKSLAAKLDEIGLAGAATMSHGLLQVPEISSTSSIGAIAWEDISAAATTLRTANFEPTACVLHPAIHEDLNLLASGDGTNASKNWLTSPPNVMFPVLATSACTITKSVIGDFSMCGFAIRQNPTVEISTTAENAFSKHQVMFKVTWRGDFSVLDPSAFHVLTGITT